MSDLIRELKWPVAVTVIVFILGTAGYFGLNGSNPGDAGMNNLTMTASPLDKGAFEFIQVKVAYSSDGFAKIFAYSQGLKYPPVEGSGKPANGEIVIGFMEAKMMRDEKLFSNIGDRVENLFGLNATVAGIINKTGGLADDFHFVSQTDFELVQGDNNAFVRLKDGTPKLFYMSSNASSIPFKFMLAEGSLDDYQEYFVAGRKYYPVLLGAKEAKMMLDEKLFSKTGDAISNFFGRDIVIVGIMQETNTSIDMMHITTLTAQDI